METYHNYCVRVSKVSTHAKVAMGLLLYAQGVSDRWQRRQGQKWKRNCGWYNYLYSVSYLTLTAGDKGIKCSSASPK